VAPAGGWPPSGRSSSRLPRTCATPRNRCSAKSYRASKWPLLLFAVTGVHSHIVDDLQRGGDELEASGEAAEVVSVDHFPAAETSPEFTNESIGTVVWLEREEYHGGEVAGACRRRQHRRGVAAAREERAAAVRIQAFYRGYLVHTTILAQNPNCQTQSSADRRCAC
jgi:hypothetical protein